jgi:replicative DNA helicase
MYEDPSLLKRHSVNIQPLMFTDRKRIALYITMQEIQDRGGKSFKSKEIATRMEEMDKSLGTRAELQEWIEKLSITDKEPNFYTLAQKFYENWRKREMARQLEDSKDDTELSNNPDLLLERYQEILTLKEKPNPFAGACRSANDTLRSTFELLEDIWEGRAEFPKVSTGFEDLDALLGGGFDDGSFVVMGAATGHGKTAAALNLAGEMAKQGTKVCFISMEEKYRDITLRLISSQSGVPMEHLKNDYITLEEKKRAKEVMTHFQSDDTALQFFCGPRTADEVIDMIRLHHDRDGSKVFIVDYMQRIKPDNDNPAGISMAVARFAMALGELSRELGLVIIGTSQLQRTLRRELSKRKPGTFDLSESNFLECEAAYIYTLYRQDEAVRMFPELENNDDLYDPNDRGTMEFILCKHRNGPTGSVKLDFAASAVRLSPRIHQPDPDDYSESGDTDIPFE